jgi:predicted esterase
VSPHRLSAHTVPATIHGRYCLRPAIGKPAGLLIAFHGYAQHAEGFASDVAAIPAVDDSWLLVSVQGLHRFYTRAGDVVASWMTSQDRELMIADNVAYVRAVVSRIRADSESPVAESAPLAFLGFSQGVAMAFRAAADHGPLCAGVIALGGDVPPDVRATVRSLPPVLIGRGTAEEWYTADKLASDVSWLREIGNDVTVREYEGGHEWTNSFREAAAAFLRARSCR